MVRVRSQSVVAGRSVDTRLLGEMLAKGLVLSTGTSTAAEAWQSLLGPDDVVGLKFNRSGAKGLGTTAPMAEALVASLIEAGLAPSQLVPIEVPSPIGERFGTTRPDPSWDTQETSFGSGSDRLAAVLRQVTAIINVPFLKTHNIAGMTCCLKNLSHALVKHPAKFHDNHCSPYIADVVALPEIKGKLRLHIVNGLRLVYEGGPEAPASGTAECGFLLIGRDPVAVDVVGLGEINYLRQDKGLRPIDRGDGSLDYLAAAGARGLGCNEVHDILLEKVSM
ncbi:MAG: DUF362 domain-containing protein [Planctomycetota bacterium]